MSRVVPLALLGLAAAGVAAQMPEIQRYIKMKRM